MVHLTLDISGLRRLLEIPERADGLLKGAARDLTGMAHAKAVQLAAQRLKTRRRLFVEGLSVSQVDEFTWALVLNAKAVWVDSGSNPRDMLKDLLASPKAKISKKGKRYLIVPFSHGSTQDATPEHQESIDAIKGALKARGVAFGAIERDESGRPLYGRLHSFSVDAPLKAGAGPGQGHGLVGSPRQGMSARNAAVNQGAGGFESSKARGGGAGHLQGVAVYQKRMPFTGPKELAYRDILTFRVASENHEGGGRWRHPGSKPAHIFQDVHSWLVQTWEQEIGPAIMAQLHG